MKKKVALIIIFNHRYDKNIKTLEQVYKDKFSNIYFLVPFYDGTQPNVIPVYENSFFFEGYIAQGYRHYFREEYGHYLFAADDMILNPAINENNYADYFQLEPDDNFIPEIFSLHNFTNNDTLLTEDLLTSKRGRIKKYWWRTMMANNYNPNKKGVEIATEIPDYKAAEARLKQHGFTIEPLQYNDIYGGINTTTLFRYKIKKAGKLLLNAGKLLKKFPLKYPLVASYSDILIVSNATIQKFVHYCGVFAATELFVELAIPTALLLASDKVKTEPVIGKRGILYWNYSPEQIAKYNTDMQPYHYELSELLKHFPADKLYIHPIKLSKWKTDLSPGS